MGTRVLQWLLNTRLSHTADLENLDRTLRNFFCKAETAGDRQKIDQHQV